MTGPLYARITWFQRFRTAGDVDNIAKLILDALKGVVIQDDDDIVRCLIQKTVADAAGDYLYDPDGIPSETLRSELQILLGAEDHVFTLKLAQSLIRESRSAPSSEEHGEKVCGGLPGRGEDRRACCRSRRTRLPRCP